MALSSIGLLNEKPLHASLKGWYAQPGDQIETVVDGYVIDIVRDGQLLEIQTGNFSSIKSKLAALVHSHKIRLIYPIPQEKWIVKLSKDDAQRIDRRKSPKRGRVEDLFWEMVRFPQLMANPNFSLNVIMIREEEVRRYEENRNWRRKGWVTEERRLLEVVDQRSFDKPVDWRVLIPEGLVSFTARDLAETIDIRKVLAQKMVYCLRKAGIINLRGKRGKANLYALSANDEYSPPISLA